MKALLIAQRCKSDLLAVGRPGGVGVVRFVVGEVLLVRAVGIHDIDFEIAVAIAREGNLLAVGRPAGTAVAVPLVGVHWFKVFAFASLPLTSFASFASGPKAIFAAAVR